MAFSAGMFSGARRELLGCQAAQIIFGVDRRETLVHFGGDEFGLAKWGASPGRDRTVFAGPIVNVLQDVTVNLTIAVNRDRQIVRQRQ